MESYASSFNKGDTESRLSTSYKGDRRQLTVLVSFSDLSFRDDEQETLVLWNKIFNQPDFREEPFVGSVHDYFLDQSYGEFRLAFDLHYVALSEPHAKYRSTLSDDENSKYLVGDILDVLEQRDIDWSRYDWNGDGFVNQLLIVFAGKGSAYGGFGGDYNSIWPHQWWLSEHENCQPRTVDTAEGSYQVDTYCCLAELFKDDSYGSFGTICHEYSHCFGLPDFYGPSTILNSWDLMDYGNYNGGGFCPCNYSAHERMLMGWLTPKELAADTIVADMPALADEPQAYLIRNDGYADEFYLIENRQPKGWDAELPGRGIVVFRIDYDADLWASLYDYVNDGRTRHYTIVPANNQTSYLYRSGWPYPYGDNNLLTDTSEPAATLAHANADGSYFLNKPLTHMAVTADGLASFHFGESPATAIRTAEAAAVDASSQVLCRFGPVLIVRTAQGEIRKIIQSPKR